MEGIYKFPHERIVRVEVTGSRERRTVEEVAKEFHTLCHPGNHSYVFNGDDYGLSASGQSNSYWKSQGVVLNNNWREWRPIVCADVNNRVAMWFKGRLPTILNLPFSPLMRVLSRFVTSWYPREVIPYNAFSLTRHLILNGKINPAFQDDHVVNNFIGFGMTEDNEFCIYFHDGWDVHHANIPAQGITKTQGAQNMIEMGVFHGGDGGYGGGLVVAWNGIVINDWYNDGDPMHRNINHLCLEVFPIDTDPEPPVEPDPGPISDDIVKVVAHFASGKEQDFYPNA